MDERKATTGSNGSSKSLDDKLASLSDPSKKKKSEMRPFINEQKDYLKHVGLCEGLVEMRFLSVASSQFNTVPSNVLMYEYSYDQFVDHANSIQYQENNLAIAEEKQRKENQLKNHKM